MPVAIAWRPAADQEVLTIAHFGSNHIGMNLVTVLRSYIIAFILAAAGVLLCACPLSAARPPRQPAEQAVWDPEAFFDRLFGAENHEDKKALSHIQVSIGEEKRLGKAAVEAYLGRLKREKIRVVSRGKDVKYFRQLVETIRPFMKQRTRYRVIEVYVAQSSRCDARSFPGGTLVFFRGLLESADNEAAVLGIVGHELSHLDRGHQLWRLRRIKLAQQTFSETGGRFSPDRFFAAGTLLAGIFTRPFRPEYEAEADHDGARWAYQAGYDPREMAKLFLKLRQRHKNRAIPLPEFLQTHPPLESRHRTIMDLYGQLQEAEPRDELYIGTENLRRRIARSRRRFAE